MRKAIAVWAAISCLSAILSVIATWKDRVQNAEEAVAAIAPYLTEQRVDQTAVSLATICVALTSWMVVRTVRAAFPGLAGALSFRWLKPRPDRLFEAVKAKMEGRAEFASSPLRAGERCLRSDELLLDNEGCVAIDGNAWATPPERTRIKLEKLYRQLREQIARRDLEKLTCKIEAAFTLCRFQGPGWMCDRPKGHEGRHLVFDGIGNTSPACPVAACELPEGHAGAHFSSVRGFFIQREERCGFQGPGWTCYGPKGHAGEHWEQPGLVSTALLHGSCAPINAESAVPQKLRCAASGRGWTCGLPAGHEGPHLPISV